MNLALAIFPISVLSASDLAVPPNPTIYHLRAPSAIGESCFLGCTCNPQRAEPLRGSFSLLEIASDTSTITSALPELAFRGQTLHQTFTGTGTYIVGRGLPGLQIVTADVSVNGAPSVRAETGRRAYGVQTTIDMTLTVGTSACASTVLTILATPLISDWNADGAATTADIFNFLNAWFAGDGDANDDGLTNTQDILDFINAWLAGV